MAPEPANAHDLELGQVLSALSDPHRRKVIKDLIQENEGVTRSCTSFGLDLSRSTRSHHFKVLREAGLVHQVDLGNRSEVSLRRAELEERFPGLLALIAAED